MRKRNNNPWAGLAAYVDPETSPSPLKFCGRDNEAYDVTVLTDENLFVTLYGKSGVGKTSLLNAGVFPRLRSLGYLPICIRLGMESDGVSFQKCIISKLSATLKERDCHIITFDVTPMSLNEQAQEYLWSYFARNHFTDKDNHSVFPVFVLDQFEEVFKKRKKDAETLLRQLNYLTDESHAISDRIVDGRAYTYDFNYRFILSIREDDLYCLEDCIDNNYLVSMKRCRYRLRSLTGEGARDVILKPGEGLFEEHEVDRIVDTIISTAQNNEDDSISTNVLSLICSQLFIESERADNHLITNQLVLKYIGGNPFEKFYNEATVGLSNKERAYIEDHLIDSAGRRNSISESDFLLHVKNGEKLLEGPLKILQRVSTSSSSKDNRIELIHDSFCEPLSGFQQKRQQRRRRKLMMASLGVALLSIGIAIVIHYQMYHVKILNLTMLQNNARFVSEKANELTDDGDSYTARVLALYILKNRPYVIEAEAALRNASYHNSAILRGHDAPIVSVKFNEDGKLIISQSVDSTIIVWNASDGRIVEKKNDSIVKENLFGRSKDGRFYAQMTSDETIFEVRDITNNQLVNSYNGHKGGVVAVCFSPDNKTIASVSTDNTIIIWDISGVKIETLKGHTNHVSCIAFSPDGKRLVSGANDNTVRIWDLQCVDMERLQLESLSQQSLLASSISHDGTLLASVPDYNEKVCVWNFKNGETKYTFNAPRGIKCTALSPDNKHIACGYNNGEVRLFLLEDGSQVHSWKGHQSNVTVIAFSPDGRYIASSSSYNNDSIKLWDAKTYKLLHSYGDHTDRVNNVVFDRQSKMLASVSEDNTIKIWDCKSGRCLKSFVGHNDAVTFAAFSSSGQQIVSTSSDNTIRIWDVPSGKQVTKLEGHTERIKAVSFYNDDSMLVSATNNQIMVWDISSGVVLSKMEGRSKTLCSLFINPQDNRICTTYVDGIYEKWSFPSLTDLIDNLNDRFGAVELSSQQLEDYYLK